MRPNKDAGRGQGPRPLAINSYSYIWKMDAYDTLVHLSDRGYRQVELMVNPPHLWPSELDRPARRRVERLISQRNIEILSLNPPMLDLNYVSPAPEMRRYTLDHYRRVIELAGEWGARWVILVPGKTHPLLPAPPELRDRWLAAALDELDRAAERQGVALLMENVPASYIPRAEQVMEALRLLASDRIRVIYDVANAVFAGEDPAEGLRTVMPRLDLVHLSDTGQSTWQHAPVGSGVVPFQAVADTLDAVGFDGPTVLEVISQDPDSDIAASHDALAPLGWDDRPDTHCLSGTD